MLRGIDTLTHAVRVTLGPKGRNVLLDKSFGPPRMTKDGGTVTMLGRAEKVMIDKENTTSATHWRPRNRMVSGRPRRSPLGRSNSVLRLRRPFKCVGGSDRSERHS
jgi:hypothetical protein